MIDNRIKAIFFYVLHLILSFGNDAITKFLIKDIKMWEIIFFRLVVGTISLLLIVLFNFKKQNLKTNNFLLHFARGTIFFIGISLWSLGYKYSHLSTGTLLAFTIPIFVLIMGPIFLGEKVKKELWLATIFSFTGVLVILNPKGTNFNYYAFFFILACVLFAGLDIINKKFITKESMINMLFYSSLVGCLYTLYPAYTVWITPTINQLILLALLGISGNLLLFFLLKSFYFADATFLAPFRYIEIIISALGGWFIFNELPPKYLVIGAFFIIPSALYISFKYDK